MGKPQIGQPCNGCGLCCKSRTCMNGAYVLRLVRHLGDTIDGCCPALEDTPNGRYTCGIIANPLKYIKGSEYPASDLSRNFAILVGAGLGCDELLENDTPEEEAALQKMLEMVKYRPEFQLRIKKAMKVIHNIKVNL